MTITLDAEQTKSFRGRVIPITMRLSNLLQSQFDEFPYKPDDLIMGGRKNCRKSFNSILDAAGIEDFVFHSLRHTAITWMDLAGVSEMVKKISSGIQPATCIRFITIRAKMFLTTHGKK